MYMFTSLDEIKAQAQVTVAHDTILLDWTSSQPLIYVSVYNAQITYACYTNEAITYCTIIKWLYTYVV